MVIGSQVDFSQRRGIFFRMLNHSLLSDVNLEQEVRANLGLFVAGPTMEQIWNDIVEKIAPNDYPTFIYGETGTGKRLMARAIHQLSPRASGPFVTVDCGALEGNLAGTQLFGYEKGSFTGADQRGKNGFFQQANKGSIFFDEIGNLPLALQPLLLRVLEDGTFIRLGRSVEERVDARPIFATNDNLAAKVARGEFRKDLLFRLADLQVRLPPLRDTEGFIPELLQHFLMASRKTQSGLGISDDALDMLCRYAWPGNVREMRAVIRRLRIMVGSHLITRADVVRYLFFEEGVEPESFPRFDTYKRDYLVRLLQHTGHNVKEAARISGIARSTLHQLISKYDISRTLKP